MKEKITSILCKIPIISSILGFYRTYNFKRIAKRDPRINANKVYRSVFHKDINWDNPKNLIEKIYWLQMFSDTSLWTLCADKFKMRSYVQSKGCGDILPDLFGHWEDANQIDYSLLPNSFVLKTTNGCGQVLLVKDKAKINIQATNSLLNSWLKLKYGFTDGQIHYSRIKPCIIAEEYLSNSSDNSNNKSLIDYKVWCLNGEPEYILVVYDRVILGPNQGYKLSAYDLNWNNISSEALAHDNKHYDGTPVKQPQTLHQMLEYARKLSADFCEVRVDFYETNGTLHLGEMTFSSGYGSHKKTFYEILGAKLDLSKAKLINRINRPPKV